MGKRNRFFTVVIGLLSLCSTLSAGEIPGFLYITKDFGPGLNENLRLTRMSFTTQNIKLTIIVDDNPITYLYDVRTSKDLKVLNVLEQTYVDMRPEDLKAQEEALAAAIEAQKAELEKRAAELTPTDAAQVIEIIPPKVLPPLRWVDSDIAVHRWSTTKYISGAGEVTYEELYTTPWFMVGLKPENFAIFETLKENFSVLFQYLGTSVVPGLGSRKTWEEPHVKGIPVQFIRFRNNKPYRTMKALRMQRFLFKENYFDLPDTYTKSAPEKNVTE